MLKFDQTKGTFEAVSKSNLKQENILERYDLQKTIVASWDLFKNEIGLPAGFLIGQEIKPDSTTQNSIDLLAYDAEDSSLVVIELKRSKNKLQLLQAMSYAAMVSKWAKERVIEEINKQQLTDHDELLSLAANNPLNDDVKIILIAETFDPEVIVTADWLSGYSISTYAFSIVLHQNNNELLMTVDQRYPLKELEDVYEPRKKKRRKTEPTTDISWDDVIAQCEYGFAARAIEMCRKIKSGDPSRKRFSHFLAPFDKFDYISFFFRNKYVNVYLTGPHDVDIEYIKNKFKTDIKVSSWKNGYSLIIDAEEQLIELVELDPRLVY